MKDPMAILCIGCDKLLNSIKTLEAKLENLYSTIKDKLTVRQRDFQSDNEDSSSRKQPRMQVSLEAASQEVETICLGVTDNLPTSSSERQQSNSYHDNSSFTSVQPSPPVKVRICKSIHVYILCNNIYRL